MKEKRKKEKRISDIVSTGRVTCHERSTFFWEPLATITDQREQVERKLTSRENQEEYQDPIAR